MNCGDPPSKVRSSRSLAKFKVASRYMYCRPDPYCMLLQDYYGKKLSYSYRQFLMVGTRKLTPPVRVYTHYFSCFIISFCQTADSPLSKATKVAGLQLACNKPGSSSSQQALLLNALNLCSYADFFISSFLVVNIVNRNSGKKLIILRVWLNPLPHCGAAPFLPCL